MQIVKCTVGSIQETQRLERRLQDMTRIEDFVESLVKFEKVITDILKETCFVAVIWVRDLSSQLHVTPMTDTMTGLDQFPAGGI